MDDLLMQRVDREDGVIVEGTFVQLILLCLRLMQVEYLIEICKGSDIEDSDDNEFPPVIEIGLNYLEKQRAKQNLSRGHASTKTARVKRACHPLKRKARNIQGQSVGKFIIFNCYLCV
jgi:hypothetical protein